VYVFIRRDLSIPQQAVQCFHVAILAAHSLISSEEEHPHIALCGVKDEQRLYRVTQHLDSIGVRYKTFQEADLNDQLTSIATEPITGEVRRHFRKYQLLKAPGKEAAA
jgi:hypothetical protein